MSRRDAMNRARESADSPFYTPAKYIPGQMEMPVGYVHHCSGGCNSDYICDAAHCDLETHTPCTACGGPESHLAEGQRRAAESDAAFDAEMERRREELRMKRYGTQQDSLF